MTWFEHKEQGRAHYVRNDYAQALESFRAALQSCGIPLERQILLSNIVACRLKLDQPEEALVEAKECIAIQPSWSKGYVRLASAYIALQRSNDACNSLQKALSLDPTNTLARQMLREQLRRGHLHPQPSAPPEYLNDGQPSRTCPTPTSVSSSPPAAAAGAMDPDDGDDMSVSWMDRFRYFWMKAMIWYFDLSEETKTALKVLITVLVLYLAFGGINHNPRRGNYDQDNAYERYRRGADTCQEGDHSACRRQTTTTSSHYSSSTSSNSGAYSRADTIYHSASRSSWNIPSPWNGGPLSIVFLAAFFYCCHKTGMNPFYAFWILNRVAGGRGMERVGMYGMMYEFGRNHLRGRNFGRRPRNGWY